MGKPPRVGAPPPGGPHRSGKGGCLAVLLISLILLLAVGWLAARTDGFRGLLESRLGQRLGVDIRLGAARLVWPYDLLLENISTANGGPGMWRIKRLRAGLRWDGSPRVLVEGAEASFRRVGDSWSPAPLAGLGGLQDLSEVHALFADELRRWHLDVKDSAIWWAPEDGAPLSLVEGLTFRTTRIRALSRPMRYYELAVRALQRGDGRRCRQFHREWIAVEGHPYVEIEHGGEWDRPRPGVGPGGPQL